MEFTMPVTAFEPITGQGGSGSFSDRRARLSAKGTAEARALVYGTNSPDNILQPLYTTGGLMWPYTPIVTDNASVQYDSYDPIHTNQPFMAFKSVAPKEIMCSGQFTAMNQEEAEYCLAAIHFLRTITKMYFGVGGSGSTEAIAAVAARGTPPPILLFNAHGTAMFHNVPVIVTSYSIELPQDVDYVELSTSQARPTLFNIIGDVDDTFTIPDRVRNRTSEGISAWIPTRFNITVNMTVQNTPNRLRRNFNLNDFRTGGLIKKGGWV